MMLLGTITGGLAYTRSIGLTNAVREGARFGATGDIASATWSPDVIDRVRETQFDDEIDRGSRHHDRVRPGDRRDARGAALQRRGGQPSPRHRPSRSPTRTCRRSARVSAW